jgi:hypothetical protein
MDPDVTAPVTLPVTVLVRAVQRRLWIESLYERERRAVWASAGVVLAGGAWHVAIHAHAGSWTAAVAVAVLAVPLALAVLTGRPPAEEAARRADAWFDGRELMTSAVDQLARPPAERAGAADFVLSRAAEAAVVWRDRLATRRLHLGLRRLAAPLVVALVGGFLHVLPGRVTPAGVAAGAAARSVTAVAPAGAPLAWSRPPGPSATAAARTGALPAAPAEVVARDAATAERTSPAPGAAAGPGTGPLPGGAAPRDEVLHPRSAAPLDASFVDLPRADGRQADGSGAAELAGDVPPAASGEPAAGPAAAVELGARPDLPPALRAYVAAYLRRVGAAR